jgi:hypothetical protein
MGCCCSTKSLPVENFDEIEMEEKNVEVIEQSTQTSSVIEIVYSEGPIGIRLLPAEHGRVVVKDLIDTGNYISQTEIYNNMVPPHLKIQPGLRIVHINRENVMGWSYNEVLDALKRPSRPLYVGFSRDD